MSKVTVSAPGKLHLSGEHAVVYGNPAVVVSTSLRLYVTLTASAGSAFGDVRKNDPFIDAIAAVFEKKMGKPIASSLGFAITSTIPVGAGMGSSAALAVALIGALSQWYGFPWEPKLINELAYQAEKTKHINSSGSDPAIVTHGGILWYRRELDFLKTFWLLPFKIPKMFAPFVLVNTKRKESTGDLVSAVAKYQKLHERQFILLRDAFEQTTKQMTQAIHDEDEQLFRRMITQNQRLLEKLPVVSREATAFIRAVEKAGGAAKISGAGGVAKGSGVVITTHSEIGVLQQLADTFGYKPFQTVLGGDGVRVEQMTA